MNAVAALGPYVDCLQRRDLDGAVQIALDLHEDGAGLDQIVALLSAAQRDVGDRWARNEWSVAQEHASTAITDRVLALVAAAAREPVVYPKVIVVCAEGDWHTLPGRMFADLLRDRGWDARFLGGSVPSRDLQQHLTDERPLAVAVTCAIPLYLGGAMHTIAAAHAAEVPVVAGGRGFGAGPARAVRLGADAWASSADEAAATLQHWAADGAPPLGRADAAAVQRYRELRAQRDALVVHALDELQSRLGYLQRADERQRERTREDLHYLAGFAEAAVLTDDATVLAAYFPWLRDVLTSRGVPQQVLAPTVSAVTSALSAVGQEAAAQLLRAAASPVVDGLGP